MDEKKIIDMKPIALYEVKDILKEKMKEKELNYEQEITMKYVEQFSKLTEKQTKDLYKELKEIDFLKENDELLYQVIAALPTHEGQVKHLLPKDIEVSDEELKKVVSLTKKFGDKI